MAERLGRYVLERKLAMGGMAEVFVAKQTGAERFERPCIVKRMLPHLAEDSQFVEMFLDEARLAAQLNHPNIAPIYDFGEQDGTYFIAMEYVAGSDLRALIREHARRKDFVPLPLTIRITSQAASALEYAHQAIGHDGQPLHIVHRDVSPPNILLGTSGVVKLIDFGIAKAAGSDRQKTSTGVIKGKMAYMSPEQVLGTGLDGRSDIFSLGLVLFELLTNVQAISGETHMALVESLVKRPLPKVAQYRRDLPEELIEIVGKAMERDRDHRVATAGELCASLERLLTTLGVTVTPSDLSRLVSGGGTPPARPAARPSTPRFGQEPKTLPGFLDAFGKTHVAGRPNGSETVVARRPSSPDMRTTQPEPEPGSEPEPIDPTLPPALMQVVPDESAVPTLPPDKEIAPPPVLATQTVTQQVPKRGRWLWLVLGMALAGLIAFESQNPAVVAKVHDWIAAVRGF